MTINKTRLIAHRGNIHGPNPSGENLPLNIDSTLLKGYDVEVDLWCEGKDFFLGHDKAEYKISASWLKERKEYLWIHCKNLKALEKLTSSDLNLNFFFHDNDFFTLTSKGFIWTLPSQELSKSSICVMPEHQSKKWLSNINSISKNSFGICSDYIKIIEDQLP